MKDQYITLRSNGRYQVRVEIDGKRIVRQCRTLEQARSIRNELLKLSEKPKKISADTLVAKLIPLWLNDLSATKQSGNYERYCCNARNHIVPRFGSLKPNEISAEVIQKVINDLQDQGLTDATVHKIRGHIKVFLEWCRHHGLTNVNAAESTVVLPRNLSVQRTAMTSQQIEQVLAIAKKKQWIFFVMFLLYLQTDCRRGEIAGLQWEQVDLQSKTISIDRQLTSVGYKVEAKPYTKNKVSRVLALSDKMVFYMHLMKALQKKESKDFSGKTFVFHRYGEEYIHPQYITKVFRWCCKEAGIPNDRRISLHSLRHTATSIMLKRGIPFEVVQKIGGWKKVETLFNVYAHVDNDMVMESMQRALF